LFIQTYSLVVPPRLIQTQKLLVQPNLNSDTAEPPNGKLNRDVHIIWYESSTSQTVACVCQHNLFETGTLHGKIANLSLHFPYSAAVTRRADIQCVLQAPTGDVITAN